MRRWKILRTGLSKGKIKTALFDLDADLCEENDVVEQHPDIVKQMEQIMRDSHVPPTLDAFKLKALGD